MYLHAKANQVYRSRYNIDQFIGELGGVMRVLITAFGVIFYPISRYIFYLNSVKKLYLARTSSPDLL